MKKLCKIVLALVTAVTLFGCKGQTNDIISKTDIETTNLERKQELAQLALMGDYKVSEEAAAESLLSFLVGKEKIDTATVTCPENTKNTNRNSSVEEYDDVDFYLYQIGNSSNENIGYAVLSNDRRIGEIISIVDNTEFSEDISDNPFMQFFCLSLEKYIEDTAEIWNSLTDNDLNTARASYADMILSGDYSFEPYKYIAKDSNISHMLSTAWRQREPCNNAIVAITKNNYIAGCGAVGIAQVMAHHEYPSYCSSETTSIIKNNWSNAKGWDGFYNWYAMKNMYHASNLSSNGQMLVGALMYQVATGIKSNFGTSSTGSDGANYIPFLTSVGYKCGNKQSYSFNPIKDSIDRNCPVLAMGYSEKKVTQKKFLWWKWESTSYYSGHVWVIDAYCKLNTKIKNNKTGKVESDLPLNYVHCNLGWDGIDNGFYLDNVFTVNMGPTVETNVVENLARNAEYEDYYQYVLEIIPNIQPNRQ